LRRNRCRREDARDCCGGKLGLGHGGGLRAVKQVPDDGRAVVVLGVDGAGVEHRDGRRRVEQKGVKGVGVLREPHLDGLDLARTETRRNELRRARERTGRDTNLELLLVERRRHQQFVGVQVHVVADGHPAVNHTELLDLELCDVKGKRSSVGGDDAVADPELAGGVQGASDLNLLGQGVGRERDGETVVAGHTPDGDRDVGVLVDVEIRRDLALGAAELEEGLGLGLGANLAKVHREDLLARKEVLGRTTDTERDLGDGRVAPALLQSERAVLSVDRCGVVAEHDEDVLQAIPRGDNENRRAGGLVGEVLGVAGVVLNGDGLDLAVVRVGVVKIFALAEVGECSGGLGGHLVYSGDRK